MRSVFVLACVALALPATSSAQDAITADLVLEPMIIAAEADLQSNELARALSRASFVTEALPSSSALATRAAGLTLLAQHRLAGGMVAGVTPSVALAPLVDAAELDRVAGRMALAEARLDLVIARLPASDPLAVRAAALRAATLPPATTVPPSVVAAPTIASPQVVYVPASSGGYAVPSGVPASEPRRRRGSSADWSLAGPGIGLLAGGWLVGWVTTLVWNLASTTCRSSSFGFPTSCTVAGPFGDAILQMLVPIIGPWWTIGSQIYRGNDVWFPALIGIMQPVGIILLIVGLVSHGDPEPPPQAGTVRVTPTGTGLAIDGWF